MRKYAILIVAVLIVAVALGADQVLTITVPDAHVPRVTTAFLAQKDSHITITIRGSQNALDPNVPDYSASVDYRVESDPNESNAEYIKRFVISAMIAFVEAHEQKLLEDVKDVYDSNSPSTDPNVPDNIVQ